MGVAVNSRQAKRERPHVCTISGVRQERGTGGGGVGGGKIRGSHENSSVLKQNDYNCTTSHNHALSAALVFIPLSLPVVHANIQTALKLLQHNTRDGWTLLSSVGATPITHRTAHT